MTSPTPWKVVDHVSGEFCSMILAKDGIVVTNSVEKKEDALLIVSSVNDSMRLVSEYRESVEAEIKRLRKENDYLRGIELINETLANQLLEARRKLDEYEKK